MSFVLKFQVFKLKNYRFYATKTVKINKSKHLEVVSERSKGIVLILQ